jgi:hypothetical protein
VFTRGAETTTRDRAAARVHRRVPCRLARGQRTITVATQPQIATSLVPGRRRQVEGSMLAAFPPDWLFAWSCRGALRVGRRLEDRCSQGADPSVFKLAPGCGIPRVAKVTGTPAGSASGDASSSRHATCGRAAWAPRAVERRAHRRHHDGARRLRSGRGTRAERTPCPARVQRRDTADSHASPPPPRASRHGLNRHSAASRCSPLAYSCA